MPRIIIIGPPGSGKGTQAERLADQLGIVAISTGNIFRANVKEGTALGLEARRYLDAGDFVPDSVTNRMVRERLQEQDALSGFILDGYPRTTSQVDYLDEILCDAPGALDAVLHLTADDEELVVRLLARALVDGRSDDDAAVIQHRLSLYREQTSPVVSRYSDRNLVAEIDGMGAIHEVTDRLLTAFRLVTA